VTSMQRGQFANQQALRDYADAHDLAYVWEGTKAFAKRWRLCTPDGTVFAAKATPSASSSSAARSVVPPP
jgi:hypothetical protein